jgi:hypothetical protein
MGEMYLQSLGRKAWKKRGPLGRPKCRWKDFKEIGLECMDWIHLAQNRDQWWALVNMVINLCFP